MCIFMTTEKKGLTYSTPTLLAEWEKKCWELVQLITFKAMILTVAGIVLEPAEFSVSATAEHAVVSYGGLRICFPKILTP